MRQGPGDGRQGVGLRFTGRTIGDIELAGDPVDPVAGFEAASERRVTRLGHLPGAMLLALLAVVIAGAQHRLWWHYPIGVDLEIPLRAAQRWVAGGDAYLAAAFHKLYEDQKLDRLEALRRMTVLYRDLMHANDPVHEWPVA